MKGKGIWPTQACVFIRGGNWNNGSNAGAFALNLNNSAGSTNNNIGFRCAKGLHDMGQSLYAGQKAEERALKTQALFLLLTGKIYSLSFTCRYPDSSKEIAPLPIRGRSKGIF
jgi:hypothetical protein